VSCMQLACSALCVFGARSTVARHWAPRSIVKVYVKVFLARAMRENLELRSPQCWSVGFESFLRHIQALPEGGLTSEEGWVVLKVDEVLEQKAVKNLSRIPALTAFRSTGLDGNNWT